MGKTDKNSVAFTVKFGLTIVILALRPLAAPSCLWKVIRRPVCQAGGRELTLTELLLCPRHCKRQFTHNRPIEAGITDFILCANNLRLREVM